MIANLHASLINEESSAERISRMPNYTERQDGRKTQFGVFSFFSGAGLLDLGFEDSGYEVLAVNELSESFMKAYVYSREQLKYQPPRFGYKNCSIDWFLSSDGSAWLKAAISSARSEGLSVGFIGGPPCPDFSVGGKNRGRHGDNGRLSESYIDLICEQKPDWFLFENVKGLWRTAKHREFFEHLKEKLLQHGYELSERLLNSIQFGVPQDRDRIFLFGRFTEEHSRETSNGDLRFPWEEGMKYRDRDAFKFDWPDSSDFGSTPTRTDAPEELTVAYWFKRNRVEEHPNANHYFKPRAGLYRFETVLEGDDSRKSFKRLHRWRYSPTVCYGNNEVHLHPWLPRRISAAEAIALQSLPPSFVLPPDMTLSAMFKTIGNGVPYLLSKGVAQAISKFLTSRNQNHESILHPAKIIGRHSSVGRNAT